MNLQRRYPIAAEVQLNGGTHFRVWAPRPLGLVQSVESIRAAGQEKGALFEVRKAIQAGLITPTRTTRVTRLKSS